MFLHKILPPFSLKMPNGKAKLRATAERSSEMAYKPARLRVSLSDWLGRTRKSLYSVHKFLYAQCHNEIADPIAHIKFFDSPFFKMSSAILDLNLFCHFIVKNNVEGCYPQFLNFAYDHLSHFILPKIILLLVLRLAIS